MPIVAFAARLRKLHPATAVLIAVAAVFLLWQNLRIRDDPHAVAMTEMRMTEPGLDPILHFMFFRGWPISLHEVCIVHGMKFHPEESPLAGALLLDGMVALMLLALVGLLGQLILRGVGPVWSGCCLLSAIVRCNRA